MASLEMKQLKNRMLQMVEQGIMFKFDGKMDYSIVRKIRKSIEMTSSYMPNEPGVTFSSDNLNGVEVELLTPEKLWGEDIIIYIHGGGFINGNILTSRGFASQLAAESGLRVYTLSYRLAPENPFPAAPDDCLTVYKALLKISECSNLFGGGQCWDAFTCDNVEGKRGRYTASFICCCVCSSY